MAISWHWAFGPETAADLASDYGFIFNSTAQVTPTSAAGSVYTYAGSPTRYSLGMRNIRSMTLPAEAYPTTGQGVISVPFKELTGAGLTNGSDIIQVTGSTSGRNTRIEVTATSALSLYVDQVFKESTVAFNWNDWRYVTLKFRQDVNPWEGQIFVDGVAVTSLQTDAQTSLDSGGTILLGSASTTSSEDWLVGQVIVYDSSADTGENPRFVTRVEPNADGTDIGTWTPSVGGTDFGVVATPLDTTTYTENTTPVALDRVEVLTNGGGSDLDTALGTTTTAIDSVLVHSYSTGQSLTARAIVGDGTASETPGASQAISVGSTSYAHAVANTKPSGGAWAGTDTPEFIYEVVST